MHQRHKCPKPWKWRRRGKGMNPGTRSDVWTSASSTSSTSAHGRITLPQSNQSGVSPRVHSTVASGAKKHKWNRANRSWKRKRVGFKPKKRQGDSKWAKKNRHCGCSTPQPQSTQRQSSNSAAQNQSGQQGTPLQFISEQDITRCQWLCYGAHIGNETRTIEFKVGGGNYMQHSFCQHVSNYGCAFLNSGGGSLVVGVNDDGVVCGLYFSHEEEDKVRLQVDRIVKHLHPPLLPHNYSLQFLPVVKTRVKEHRLKVLCLTFRAPPAFSEPTLYQTDCGKVYIRRDGSIEGPLGNSVILEWSRQMWSGKVEQLEKCLDKARSEMWFLAGQVHRLRQFIAQSHSSSSSSQSSAASPFRPPVGSPYVRPAHNSRAPDLALESPPPPKHRQV